MIRSILVLRAVAGILWLAQLVMGILFWTGHALTLVQLHMSLGYLFVVALWALAFVCGRAGAPGSQVALVVVWGAIVVALGPTQVQLLPGPLHWIVRVVHLLVGLAAMPLAGRLSMMALRSAPPHGTQRPTVITGAPRTAG